MYSETREMHIRQLFHSRDKNSTNKETTVESILNLLLQMKKKSHAYEAHGDPRECSSFCQLSVLPDLQFNNKIITATSNKLKYCHLPVGDIHLSMRCVIQAQKYCPFKPASKASQLSHIGLLRHILQLMRRKPNVKAPAEVGRAILLYVCKLKA